MKDYTKIGAISKHGKNSKLASLPVLLVLFGTCSYSTASTVEPLKIIVKKHDSLSSIILRELDSRNPMLWEIVAKFNNQSVDKILEIGDVLLIPGTLIPPQAQLQVKSYKAPSKDTPNLNAKKDIQKTSSRLTSPTQKIFQCTNQDVCWEIEHDKSKADKSNSDQKSPPAKPSSATDPLLSQSDKTSGLISTAEKKPETSPTDTQSTQSDPPNSSNAGETRLSNTQSIESEQIKPAAEVTREAPGLQQETQKPSAETVATTPTDNKPGLFEVDEDAAVRALERSLVQLNALLLKPGRAELTFSFDYRFDIEFEPVLVNIAEPDTDTASQQAGQIQNQIESFTNTIDLKFGLPYDTQLNLSVPFINTNQKFDVNLNGSPIDDTQNISQSGTGDYSITFTKTLAIEKGFRPDILLDATYTGNTGSDEFGSGSEEFTLGFSATKRQDPLVFTGGFSHTISHSENEFVAGDVTQLSIGTLLAASPYTSLQFFLTQTFIEPAKINSQPLTSNRTTVASFSAGVSSVIGNEIFLNARLGMGLVENATDFRLTFSIAKQFSL